MVRIKTRWLLVRIDYAHHMNANDDDNTDDVENFPSKNELARVIRDSIVQCSGITLSGVASDTQGMNQPSTWTKLLFERFISPG
jgi:hypothetical protein